MKNYSNNLRLFVLILTIVTSFQGQAFAGYWEITCEIAPHNYRAWYSFKSHSMNPPFAWTDPNEASAENTNTITLGEFFEFPDSWFPNGGVSRANFTAPWKNGKFYVRCTVKPKLVWKREPNQNGNGAPDDPTNYVIVLFTGTSSGTFIGGERSQPFFGNFNDGVVTQQLNGNGHVQSVGNKIRIYEVPNTQANNITIPLPSYTVSAFIQTNNPMAGGEFGCHGSMMFNAYSVEVSAPRIGESNVSESGDYPTVDHLHITMSAGNFMPDYADALPTGRDVSKDPFIIPARYFVQLKKQGYIDIPSQGAMDFIASKSGWVIHSNLPGALTPIANGHGSTQVFPRFHTDNVPVPTTIGANPLCNGLGFSMRNGLPPGNSAFGPASLEHYFDGKKIGTSSLDILYPSTGTNHPDGDGDTGYEMDGQNETPHQTPVRTPNWFFYYQQAYAHPSGTPVQFVNDSTKSYFWSGDPTHIHIGNWAHGHGVTQLFERRSGYANDPTPDDPNNGDEPHDPAILNWVGFTEVWGLDRYARAVSHECEHKRIYDQYFQQILNSSLLPNGKHSLDPDGDWIPNSIEVGNDLDPDDPDSADFISRLPPVLDINGQPIYTTSNGDGEVMARLAERGVRGDQTKDWADDGLNSAPATVDGRRAGFPAGMHVENGDRMNNVTWFLPGFAYQSQGAPF